MKVHEKLFADVRRRSPYLVWAEQGRTPDEIKAEILATLRPHLQNPHVLTDFPLPILAHEAVTIRNIHLDPWASSMFSGLLSEYRDALVADQSASIAAVESWDEPIAQAMSEFLSIYLLEVDKADLDLDEFRLEELRNIGGVLEACIQPQLKALVHQVRIRRGRRSGFSDIVDLRLGAVVEELHGTLRQPGIVAPPPWNLKLHHWRNIAQHHSTVEPRFFAVTKSAKPNTK
jgi:hypothetical protein